MSNALQINTLISYMSDPKKLEDATQRLIELNDKVAVDPLVALIRRTDSPQIKYQATRVLKQLLEGTMHWKVQADGEHMSNKWVLTRHLEHMARSKASKAGGTYANDQERAFFEDKLEAAIETALNRHDPEQAKRQSSYGPMEVLLNINEYPFAKRRHEAQAAIESLKKRGATAIQQILNAYQDDVHPETKKYLLQALISVAYERKYGLDDEITQKLLTIMQTDEYSGRREQAAAILAKHFESHTDELLTESNNDNVHIRSGIIKALNARIHLPQVKERIMQAIQDEESDIRQIAIAILSELKPDGQVITLIKNCLDDAEPKVVREAEKGLKKLGVTQNDLLNFHAEALVKQFNNGQTELAETLLTLLIDNLPDMETLHRIDIVRNRLETQLEQTDDIGKTTHLLEKLNDANQRYKDAMTLSEDTQIAIIEALKDDSTAQEFFTSLDDSVTEKVNAALK